MRALDSRPRRNQEFESRSFRCDNRKAYNGDQIYPGYSLARACFKVAPKLYTIFPKVVTTLVQSCPNVVSKLSQIVSKIPKFVQKMFSDAHGCFKVVQKLCQKDVLEVSQSNIKVVPQLSKNLSFKYVVGPDGSKNSCRSFKQSDNLRCWAHLTYVPFA